MADIEFIVGSFGRPMDIPLKNPDGVTFDTSGYTAGTLTFKTLDLATVIKSLSLTIPSNGIARWTMTSGDTNITAGNMTAQIEITGSGLKERFFLMSAYAAPSLT